MLWLLLIPIIALAEGHDKIIKFENLKLKLVNDLVSCPQVSELTKDANMYWHAPGGWRSYNISFSKELVRLVGVQWQGDKVGNIFCQYKDRSKLTFPVALQAPGIYLRPIGEWSSSGEESSAIDCKANDYSACKFQQVEEVVETFNKEERLYDFLEDIKKGESE